MRSSKTAGRVVEELWEVPMEERPFRDVMELDTLGRVSNLEHAGFSP
jgi:hypothetical protein